MDKEIIKPERLNQQKHRIREIRRLQNEIDIISNQLGSPQGIKYSDMPKSRNPFDKIGMLISRKIEKENQLNKILKTAQKEAEILEEVINKISKLPESAKGASNSTYQDILRYHYLNDLTMKEIIYLQNADNDDLVDSYESKLRLLYMQENEALRKFLRCQR